MVGTAARPIALADHLLPLMSDGDDVLGVLFLFGVGLFLVYDGFRKWQQYRLMQDTPTERVRSAAAGRTELQGTAREGYGTVVRPFTDGECLLARYEVEEYRSDDDGGHWDTIDSGLLDVPFLVDDGTGTMRVEPDDDATIEISEENEARIEVDGDEVEPEVVRSFLTNYTSVDVQEREGLDGMLFESDRRYTQSILPIGATVYVLGGATPQNERDGVATSTLVMGRDEGSGEFIIADRPEEELVSRYRWLAPGEIVGGIALSAAMLFLLLA